MGVFQGDAIIFEIVNLILDDIRKDPWIIEDILSDFIENPYLAQKYGMKEITNCKEWLKNNKVEVYLKQRPDSNINNYVTISVGPSSEDSSLSTLGDLTPSVEQLDPSDISKPIPWVISPFIPISYDSSIGFISIPSEIDIRSVANGQPIVDSATGIGFLIDKAGFVNGQQGVFIQAVNGIYPPFSYTKVGVVPQYKFYRARREGGQFRETYQIGCFCGGDITFSLWLTSIVQYGLMRYREGLLEYSGFQVSSLSIGDIIEANLGQDNIYGRYITLSGLAQNTWLKSPKRVIEASTLGTEDRLNTGIKIIGPSTNYVDPTVIEMTGENNDE